MTGVISLNDANTTAVILAAGKGTRMKSKIPKVLHEVCNKPLLWHILTAAQSVTDKQTVVTGYGREKVENFLKEKFDDKNLTTTIQERQMGTGHAVVCAKNQLNSPHTMVLLGDTPLITDQELSGLKKYHVDNASAATILTITENDPHGYGRIIRDKDGFVKKIVEEADATPQEKDINEINTGLMIFETEKLLFALDKLDSENNQGEYYLTDVINILYQTGECVLGYQIEKTYRALGVNDRAELARAEKIKRQEINNEFMYCGVTIKDPESTYIDPEISIGYDTVIYPNTYLTGDTRIGTNCEIGPEVQISDSFIGDGCKVKKSQITDSILEDEVSIGPYAQIRPGTTIGSKAKIGNFVEVKNSSIGENTKANHLAYIGDADIGSNVNMGAGSVIVNYDGQIKHRTVIEDGAFVGCNSNLVAPVTIKTNAFVAAGSTVTENIPEDSLGIARCRQTNKEDWVTKKMGRGYSDG